MTTKKTKDTETQENGQAVDPDVQSVPMVNTGRALNSLRDSGHSIATALAELIDNSVEADANNVQILLQQGKRDDGKKHVERIAAIDDGSGMAPKVLHRYLQLGFSTRYMSEDTIGKYGVGAKLAALNFALRIDAWSRTSADDPWLHTSCDLSGVMDDKTGEASKSLTLAPPVADPVPDDLKEKLPDGSGTLVVWSKMDRLEDGRFAEDFNTLRVDIEKQLSRIFREFINGGISIRVNDTDLLAYDPLFDMEGHWGDYVLNQVFGDGSESDKHYEPIHFGTKTVSIGDGEARVKVTLCPEKAVQQKGEGGNKIARRLRIDGREGYISFVRQQREIAFTKPPQIFPSAVMTRDRYIGIEVSFSPELDNYFGVKNVKRGVEPHGELRAKIRDALSKMIPEARKRIDTIWDDLADENLDDDGELDAIEEEVKKANRVMPKSRVTPDEFLSKDEALEDLAVDVVGDDDEKKEDYKEKVQDLPFVIEPVGWPGDRFLNVIHLEDQSIIRLNKRHRFFKELYQPIKQMASKDPSALTESQRKRASRRALEAITLLIVSYAKAESMDEHPEESFGELRADWGKFLHTLMRKVKNVI